MISTGMYALVRHPMYFGALFLSIGTPLALGSWWALLLIPITLPALYFRIVNEEKVLLRDCRLQRIHSEGPVSTDTIHLVIPPVRELFLLKGPGTRAHNFSLHGSPSSFGRGYDADWIRTVVRQHGAWANIPPKSNWTIPV